MKKRQIKKICNNNFIDYNLLIKYHCLSKNEIYKTLAYRKLRQNYNNQWFYDQWDSGKRNPENISLEELKDFDIYVTRAMDGIY